MPEQDAAAVAAAAAAAAAPAEGAKPSEAVAGAAAAADKSTPKEEATLLGGEGKKDGDDPAKAAAAVAEAAKVIPEKYEIKAPEGMTVDAKMLEAITPIFKELGISQEGAQKLADVYAPYINQMVEAQRTQAVADFGKMIGEWKDQTTKELGANGQAELAHAAKFIDKFGGQELRQVLNETGLGNHIAVVKAFIAAGKAIANDSFPDSSSKGKTLDTVEQKAEALFPTSKQ